MISPTHTSKCDNPSCPNYDIPFDAYSQGGVLAAVICGGCSTNITHTCTPKE